MSIHGKQPLSGQTSLIGSFAVPPSSTRGCILFKTCSVILVTCNCRYVLTAAHCTDGESQFNFKVKVGEHDTKNDNDGGHVIKVASIYQHKEYSGAGFNGVQFIYYLILRHV